MIIIPWTIEIPLISESGVVLDYHADLLVRLVFDFDGCLYEVQADGIVISTPATAYIGGTTRQQPDAAIWSTALDVSRKDARLRQEVSDRIGLLDKAEAQYSAPIYGVGMRGGRYAA